MKVPLIGEIKAALRIFSKKKEEKNRRDLSRLFLERFYFSIKKKKRGVDKKNHLLDIFSVFSYLKL
jgi:hypothetical protein